MNRHHLPFSEWLAGRALHVEHVLDREMPQLDDVPVTLHQAMRYAVLVL